MENVACLGCGFEPEIEKTITEDGQVVGYHCSCRAVVVNGVLLGNGGIILERVWRSQKNKA